MPRRWGKEELEIQVEDHLCGWQHGIHGLKSTHGSLKLMKFFSRTWLKFALAYRNLAGTRLVLCQEILNQNPVLHEAYGIQFPGGSKCTMHQSSP